MLQWGRGDDINDTVNVSKFYEDIVFIAKSETVLIDVGKKRATLVSIAKDVSKHH